MNLKIKYNSHSAIRLSISVVFVLASFGLYPQPTLELKYSYLHSPEFDKVFQLYNAARPWHSSPLMPITNGYGGNVGWNFELLPKRQLHVIPQLGYQRFSTIAENGSQKHQTGFNCFSASFGFRFHPRALITGVQTCGPLGTRWFMTVTPGYALLTPFARLNEKNWEPEEGDKYNPISTAFSLGAGTGYHISSLGNFIITISADANWYPLFKLQDFAEAVNGHNITGLNNEIRNVFFFSASLRFTFYTEKKEWWNTPRT